MAKKLWILFVVMALSTNPVYAAEKAEKGKSKKSTSAPSSPPLFKEPTTGMEFVLVKGGCYQMGDSSGLGGPEEKPVHEVCVNDYYVGKYEVTQGEWKAIMGSNPSHFAGCGDKCPVENVSWNDALEFIGKLNKSGGGGKFRLPTEAEWEYAARSGGKRERYSGGDVVADIAWFGDSMVEPTDNGTIAVGQKKPNGLGIYDMSGNVWEWTKDFYSSDYYAKSPRKNPTGPSSGDRRVLRGGSFGVGSFDLRTTYRNFLPPANRSRGIGFRLVRSM